MKQAAALHVCFILTLFCGILCTQQKLMMSEQNTGLSLLRVQLMGNVSMTPRFFHRKQMDKQSQKNFLAVQFQVY